MFRYLCVTVLASGYDGRPVPIQLSPQKRRRIESSQGAMFSDSHWNQRLSPNPALKRNANSVARRHRALGLAAHFALVVRRATLLASA